MLPTTTTLELPLVASFSVEGFGLDRLKRTGRSELESRLESYRAMLTF